MVSAEFELAKGQHLFVSVLCPLPTDKRAFVRSFEEHIVSHTRDDQ